MAFARRWCGAGTGRMRIGFPQPSVRLCLPLVEAVQADDCCWRHARGQPSSSVQCQARRSLTMNCRGPGSVPPHNCHLFVCGPRGGNGDGSSTHFSRLANEAMREAAEAHAEREQASGPTAWTFGLSMCECPPECEPGDLLLFPHYLHVRPTAAASERHSSSLSRMSGALLDAIAALQPERHGEERHPGGAPQWSATANRCAGPTSNSLESDWSEQAALIEIVGSVRHRSHVFIWSQQQNDGGGDNEGRSAGSLQETLLLELSTNAALKASDVAVVQCSPPLTHTHPPDGSATTEPSVAGVSVAVFTAQSRAYATWGAGIGEWFECTSSANEDASPTSSLASVLASFLVSTHDSGAGPYTMNALAHVIAQGAAWRGRMGLGQNEALAVHNHFAAATTSVPR